MEKAPLRRTAAERGGEHEKGLLTLATPATSEHEDGEHQHHAEDNRQKNGVGVIDGIAHGIHDVRGVEGRLSRPSFQEAQKSRHFQGGLAVGADDLPASEPCQSIAQCAFHTVVFF